MGGLTASTLDITDADFKKNVLQFSGTSTASVQNKGTITAANGDLFLIGQTVDNEGSLNAPNGTAGLGAGQSVLIKQSGTQHIFVKATKTNLPASGSVAITNNGAIAAAAAGIARGQRQSLRAGD